jgi:putative ABC transport system permease protein
VSRQVAEPTRLRTADVLREAIAAIVARPLRSALTVTGTLLGVAGFVTVLGLTSTATGQVAWAFNQRLPTLVRVTVAPGSPVDQTTGNDPFPENVGRRLDALHGVLSAGVYWRIPVTAPLTVSARPPYTSKSAAAGPAGSGRAGAGAGSGRAGAGAGAGRGGPSPGGADLLRTGPAVLAASPGFLVAAGARVSQGRLFGGWDQAHAKPVCVVGATAARALGISRLDRQPAIIVNELPCTVIGLISGVRGQQWIMRSVLMPAAAASSIWDSPADLAGARPGVLIQTRPGAAALIARQAPLVLSERDPGQFVVFVPPSPRLLRREVSAVLAGLFVLLGWFCLLIGAAGITNMTLIAVGERTAEVGLRRALGARRRHIAAQFLAESAILGLLGGLAGTSVGVGAVVSIAVVRDWVPVIAPQTVLPAPLVGAALGLLAGLYPSWRAARIEPARALSEYPAV